MLLGNEDLENLIIASVEATVQLLQKVTGLIAMPCAVPTFGWNSINHCEDSPFPPPLPLTVH